MPAKRPVSFRAAAGRPCPVCLAESKGCSATDDGLHFCRGGASVDSAEWRQLSGMVDPNGFLHFRRTADDHPKKKRKRQHDWNATARERADLMKDRHYAEFAARLSLPESAVRLYPSLGWIEASLVGTTFTIPEFDSAGSIIGIMKRIPPADPALPNARDEQLMIRGGSRGLMLVTGWRERGEDSNSPVLIVEGASCSIAAAAAGLSAIGRPGADAGREYLARILADWPAQRPIIVIGENDFKPDSGKWPGRDGAEKLAQGLANDLAREVRFALPPASAKDLRAWMTSPDRAEIPWADRGAAFLSLIEHSDPSARAAYQPQAALDRPRPVILVTTEEMAVNNEAIASLTREPNLYQRGGLLVRALQSPASKTKSLDLPSSLRLVPFEKATLREVLANTAIWKKEVRGNEESAMADTHPPGWCVDAVIARGEWSGIRNLLAVVDHPVVRPDGTILTADGYDPDTELFASPGKLDTTHFSGGQGGLDRRLTIEDARRAVDILTDAVVDFPFTEPSHRSAWIAALITPLCRFAFSGPAPLFLIDANCPGTGKGLLCDIISIIVSNTRFAIASYSHSNEEMEKVITASAIAGDRLILLDNINGLFGNAAMDKALTGTIWKGRILGESKQVTVPLFATWYATGNNVTLAGDISRRIVHSKLTSTVENPDERDDFHHPDIKAFCRENRGKLLAAALAIPAAYLQAGSPKQSIPRFGSFEGWSDLVRSAIVWAGLPDPAANRMTIRRESDAELGSMGYILEKWATVDDAGTGLTASEFMERVFGRHRGENGPDEHAELRDVLRSLLKKLEPKDLGYKFRKYQGRIIGGRFLDSRRTHGVHIWKASTASHAASNPQTGFKVSNTLKPVEASENTNSDASRGAMDLFSDRTPHRTPVSHPDQTLENQVSGGDKCDGCDLTPPHAREDTRTATPEKNSPAVSAYSSHPIAPHRTPDDEGGEGAGEGSSDAPAAPAAPEGWLYVSRRLDFLTILAPDAPSIIDEFPPDGMQSIPYYRLTPPVLAWFQSQASRAETEFVAGRFPRDQMDALIAGIVRMQAFADARLDPEEVRAAMATGGTLPERGGGTARAA